MVAFPATEKLPPSVNNPLPKTNGRLLTVFKYKVPVVKSIIGFVPVKFKLDASVVVLVTVRLLIVDVAKFEMPFTLKLPVTVWLPVVVAFPVTVWLPVIVEFPLTARLPPM